MSARDILQLGNPLLWEVSAPVQTPLTPETEALVEDLDDTLAAYRAARGVGRGIAAPQIGVLQRVIFVCMQGGSSAFHGALINPLVVWADDAQLELWDDCFSFPQLMVKVRRSARIRVTYIDLAGRPRSLEAESDLSELLQHEIDHLDGILAVQRALSPRAFATRAEWERQRQTAE